MDSKAGVILKVLLLSAGLAAAIKYLAPQIDIPVTSTNALVGALLPTLVMAVALVWRTGKAKQTE